MKSSGEIMFIGEYQHNLDAKGRIIVPQKYRDGLGEKFIITKGLDKCLFAYTLNEWRLFEDKLKTLPLTDEGSRKFVRFFFSGAAECETDNQGRVIIPVNLREYANMQKDIISIGVFNRIEIWSKENWQAYNDSENFINNELAAKMAELGI